MQTEFIIKLPENKRLVIFFTGWSTSSHISSLLNLPIGYDLIICWDYRKISWNNLEKKYDEVLIYAWSYGIPAAEKLFGYIAKDQNVTGTYAINGSSLPVDNDLGIPEHIFNETQRNLDETNLKKFKIRIAGGIRKYLSLEKYLASDLSVEELKEELGHFHAFRREDIRNLIWDCIFISDEDKIFPKENLLRAWKDMPVVILPGENHLPDFSEVFNRTIKNKNNIRKNFEKSLSSYNEAAIVQNSLSRNLVDLLKNKRKKFSSILELGSGAGFLSDLLYKTYKPQKFLLMDMSPVCPVKNAEYISGDIETLIHLLPKDSFDLVASGSTMQWFHSPRRILAAISDILKDDGLAGITTFLPDNFLELKELTGNGLLYFSERDWHLMAKRTGFDILVSSVKNHEIKFRSVREILDHIKSTGVNSLSGKQKTVGEMRRIISSYPKEDGMFKLTYQTLTLILKKAKIKDNNHLY